MGFNFDPSPPLDNVWEADQMLLQSFLGIPAENEPWLIQGGGGRLQLSADDAGHPSFTLSPTRNDQMYGSTTTSIGAQFYPASSVSEPKHTLNDLQSQRNELLQLSDTGWAWQVWWSSSENSSPNNLLTRYVASMCIWGIGYPLVIHWLSIGVFGMPGIA